LKDFEQLEEEARRLALENNWGSAAIAANEAILAEQNKNIGAHNRLARCYEEAGDFESSLDHTTIVLASDPTNRIAKQRKVRVDKLLSDQAICEAGNADELTAIGLRARRTGQLETAVRVLERALALRKAPKTQIILAATYRDLGKYSLAEKTYLDVLSSSPNNEAAMVGLAAVYRDSKQLLKAQDIYQKVLRNDPRNQYALNGLGAVYYDLGRLEEAEKCFRLLFKQHGASSREATNRLAQIRDRYKGTGNLAGAGRIDELLRRSRI
jgi:tetratricopeptide (TPR) repeat protein